MKIVQTNNPKFVRDINSNSIINSDIESYKHFQQNRMVNKQLEMLQKQIAVLNQQIDLINEKLSSIEKNG